MQNIEKILVPVDLHQHTEDLADFAIAFANKLGCRLIFMHVLDTFSQVASYTEDFPHHVMRAAVDELEGEAQKKMAALIDERRTACPGCEGLIRKGEVVDTLVNSIRESGIDMVIMGTHGSKGIKKILLGSVAERVIKRAPCPILIFNPYKGESNHSPGKTPEPV